MPSTSPPWSGRSRSSWRSTTRCRARSARTRSTSARCWAGARPTTRWSSCRPGRLYRFADENPRVEFWPVDHASDPRNIRRQASMVAINATLEVDFLGQCASESLGSQYWSSTGGQEDFGRGAIHSSGGQSFIVLHSTTADGSVSRIVPQLHPGAAVTTFKNVVDRVVTEHGVAELRGRSIRERARRLIDIAAPDHREGLEHEARRIGYL